jgi:hypothetical protein
VKVGPDCRREHPDVTHFWAIDVLSRQTRSIDLKGPEAAIQREHVKEGKIV